MSALAPIAALPVAWWLFWLLGGTVVFAGLAWVLTWFAVKSDHERNDESEPPAAP